MSSVTPVHPAKAMGQNEMPLGSDTRMVLSNIALERGPCPHRRGDMGVDATYCQITLALVIIIVIVLLLFLLIIINLIPLVVKIPRVKS